MAYRKPQEFSREFQMFTWLDSMVESFDKFRNKIKKLEDDSELDHQEILGKIKDQYKLIEVLYNIEVGKASIHGVSHNINKKK